VKTIAEAFVELAAYLEIARFDDPDEAQGAAEVVSWCLAECSSEERALLRQVSAERASQLRAEGAPQATIDFYESLILRITSAAGQPEG
jgi:hypothetical protein